jgi:thiamine pyrophosphate-dependent acetolactate synthase large subunit-like protein
MMRGAMVDGKLSVADAIARLLAKMGARRCFGVLGTANFKITDALCGAGVQYIPARHEGNAASMGDAYARLSDELVLVSVHSGPGLSNSITGIGEAAKSRTPLLILAGDVATGDLRSNFYIEQAEMVRAVGATFERTHSPETALRDAARAARAVVQDRRTVVLSLPVDVQDAALPIAYEYERGVIHSTLPAPDPTAIAAAVEELSRSKRPLILAGHGAVVAKAKQSLVSLADEVGALLATSAFAHGLFADRPWSLGISGGFSSPAALELIPQSDFILGFGVSFTHWTTRKGALIGKDAKLLQVDVDPSRLGANRPVDYAIVGDARLTAEAFLTELRHRRSTAGTTTGWRTESVSQRIAQGGTHDLAYNDTSTSDHIDPRTLTKALDAILPLQRVVVSDSGHFMGWPPLYFRVPDERGWCQSASFQSVGLGLASAIGAALAEPERLVVLAIGDGGLLMSLGELETAARLRLRMCVVIYNDLAYGAEVHYFGRRGYRTDIVKFPDVNFSAIAKSFGGSAIEVHTLADLAPAQAWVAEGAPGLFVIDARVNPRLEAEWHQDAFKISA